MKGNRFRRLRQAQGMSLADLADAMGGIITRQALFRYENGTAKPSGTVARKLAAALGVKPKTLRADPSREPLTIQFFWCNHRRKNEIF